MASLVSSSCDELQDGFAFHFKFSEDDHLALRSVQIGAEGVPELCFEPSPNVPTLTEEDVAVICHLALKDKRPEFFFEALDPFHPFFGRQFKHYEPQLLRGTSVGNLLAEVDWIMKCLHIGGRSNDEKTAFWAWNSKSKFQEIGTMFDFPKDSNPTGGSVFMLCDSATVQEDANSLSFPQEPKMRIDDQTNSLYSKYITEAYPSIAYYDEPRFLKMQEIIKLILAAEWLKKKEVKLSENWLNDFIQPSQKTPQAIEVNAPEVTDEEFHRLYNLVANIPEERHEELLHETLGPISVDIKVDKEFSENGIEVKVVKKVQLSPPVSPSPKLEWTTRFRVSSKHYDWLYDGLDPNKPLPGGAVPHVQSWSELFAETVPWPFTWQDPYVGIGVPAAGGGVSTSSFPVTKVAAADKEPVRREKRQVGQYTATGSTIGVCATADYKRGQSAKNPPREMVPKQGTVTRPPSDLPVGTVEANQDKFLTKEIGEHRAFGWQDTGSGESVRYTKNGTPSKKKMAVRSCSEQKLSVNDAPQSIRCLNGQQKGSLKTISAVGGLPIPASRAPISETASVLPAPIPEPTSFQQDLSNRAGDQLTTSRASCSKCIPISQERSGCGGGCKMCIPISSNQDASAQGLTSQMSPPLTGDSGNWSASAC